jgi:hypothetical protein
MKSSTTRAVECSQNMSVAQPGSFTVQSTNPLKMKRSIAKQETYNRRSRQEDQIS